MVEGSCACGAVTWRFDGVPEGATACNCTACRRYGTLWAYDHEGEGIHVSGPTTAYVRGDSLGFHFCPTCGCMAYWPRKISVQPKLVPALILIILGIAFLLSNFGLLPRLGPLFAQWWPAIRIVVGARCAWALTRNAIDDAADT